jgi:gas vesicle protein
MANESDGMAKGLIVGFLAGGIVGAVLALLYAPKTGRELRADIKGKAKDVIDVADDYIMKAKSKASEIVNEGRSRSESLISEAKRKAGSIMDDAERILSDARGRSGAEGPKGERG